MKEFKFTIIEVSELIHRIEINSRYSMDRTVGFSHRARIVFEERGFEVSFSVGNLVILGKCSVTEIKNIIEDQFNMDVVELEIAK